MRQNALGLDVIAKNAVPVCVHGLVKLPLNAVKVPALSDMVEFPDNMLLGVMQVAIYTHQSRQNIEACGYNVTPGIKTASTGPTRSSAFLEVDSSSVHMECCVDGLDFRSDLGHC
jgi:hypothetical protein